MRLTGRRLARLTLSTAVVLVTVSGLAACGDDDEDAAVTVGGTDNADALASDKAYGSSCNPVNEQLESQADDRIEIDLDEYAFIPPEIELSAGVVTFAASNVGEEAHELGFLPGGGEVPFTEDGAPDEEALAEAGAFELEAFPPGEDCTATYALEAGDYTLFCIVEAPDGETHYEKGMAGTVTVG